MHTFDIIRYWDDNLVEPHIISELNYIVNYLKERQTTKIRYLDIGANCGRYWNILSKHFVVDQAIMVEPATELYEYLINKFKDTNFLIYDFVLSDHNGMVSLTEINFSFFTELNRDINLGLSKSCLSDRNNKVQVSAENFFNDYLFRNNIFELDLIKIDTENRDYHILKSMTNVLMQLRFKPIICFENNYHNDMTQLEAQTILDNFTTINGYQPINISNINWSSVFLCPIVN